MFDLGPRPPGRGRHRGEICVAGRPRADEHEGTQQSGVLRARPCRATLGTHGDLRVAHERGQAAPRQAGQAVGRVQCQALGHQRVAGLRAVDGRQVDEDLAGGRVASGHGNDHVVAVGQRVGDVDVVGIGDQHRGLLPKDEALPRLRRADDDERAPGRQQRLLGRGGNERHRLVA